MPAQANPMKMRSASHDHMYNVIKFVMGSTVLKIPPMKSVLAILVHHIFREA
jgi:hypothetical protein